MSKIFNNFFSCILFILLIVGFPLGIYGICYGISNSFTDSSFSNLYNDAYLLGKNHFNEGEKNNSFIKNGRRYKAYEDGWTRGFRESCYGGDLEKYYLEGRQSFLNKNYIIPYDFNELRGKAWKMGFNDQQEEKK